MGKFITFLLIGIVLVILGITNIKGNISSIHWYNRSKVSANDIPKYGKCMGSGLSQILCKHRNAVQIEQNLFKAEVAQAAAALFSK